jgi:hypothetical protein
MKWKKLAKWGGGILSVILLIAIVEGTLLWVSIGAIILLAAWRIYTQRKQIKLVLQMAGTMGAMHKAMKQQAKTNTTEPELIEPKNIKVIENVEQRQTIKRS